MVSEQGILYACKIEGNGESIFLQGDDISKVIKDDALSTEINKATVASDGTRLTALLEPLSLALSTMLAVSISDVVLLFLKRFGQGPAAASDPLLIIVTDMAGILFVLSLASLMMPWLL